MRQPLDNTRAVQIADLPDWGIVYCPVVVGAGTVRLGDNPQILKADPADGISITIATPPQQAYVWWKGKLFAISDVAMVISVQTPGIKGQGTI